MSQEEEKAVNAENQEHEEENEEIVVLEQEADPTSSAKEIESLQNEVKELHDKLLRAMAESENVRRRYEKMVEDAREYAIVSFAKDLLGVMDNLSRALEHAPKDLDSHASSILDGVNMTQAELSTVFKKHGLESIMPAPGEKFDYNLHHAISQIVTDDYNQDSIVGLMQVGYRMKDRLLRPAAVSVAKKSDLQ